MAVPDGIRPIVNTGASRYEVQRDGRRVAVFDAYADAALFAAAPALLAACERIQRALYLYGADTPGLLELLDEASPEIDAAIAAAKEGN